MLSEAPAVLLSSLQLHLLFLSHHCNPPPPTPIMSTTLLLTPFFLFLLPFLSSALPSSNSSFSFPPFDHSLSLSLLGDAHLSSPSAAITMTTGAILHRDSLPFGRIPSFSSNLSFSMPPSGTSPLLSLVLSPNNSLSSPDTFSVELRPLASTPWKRLRFQVVFDGRRKLLEVRLSDAANSGPSESPVIVYSADLTGASAIWPEEMFVGLRSSGGNSTGVVSVYNWSFEVRSADPYRMHSEPLDPSALSKKKKSREQHTAAKVRGGYGAADVAATALLAVGVACGVAAMVIGWLGRRRVEYEKILAVGEKRVRSTAKA